MRDRVGNQVPEAAEIEKLVGEVRAIEERLASFTVTLSTDERASTLKMRTGGEVIVPSLGKLAVDHGVTLPDLTVTGMTEDLNLAQRLRPLATAVDRLSQRLSDTILQAQSECWWAATAYYTVLARLTGANASLEASLKPIVSFFAVGRRKKPTAQTV